MLIQRFFLLDICFKSPVSIKIKKKKKKVVQYGARRQQRIHFVANKLDSSSMNGQSNRCMKFKLLTFFPRQKIGQQKYLFAAITLPFHNTQTKQRVWSM